MKRIIVILTLFFIYSIPLKGLSQEPCYEIVLTVEKALFLALDRNRQLLNSLDTVIKAQSSADVANAEFDFQIKPNADVGYIGGGTAGSGPAYGLGVDFSKRFAWGTRVNVNPFIIKANKMFHSNLRAIITQPLLRGLGNEFSCSYLRGTEFNLRSALRSYYTSQCQLIYRTIFSLYDLVKSHRSVTLSQESYERMKRFDQAAKLKSKMGLSDPLDIYRSEIEMRQAEDSLKASQERFQESEDAIRDLLALPPDIPLFVDIPMEYNPNNIEFDEALQIALNNRIELDQANDQVTENTRLSKLAKNRLWPELNLTLNYSNLAQDQVFTETWRKRRESTWGVGFTTSTDFNPVAEKASYEQSLLAIEISNRGVEQATANITFEVKRSLRLLNRTLERIELQKKQMRTTEGELRLAQVKFDRGMGNNFDLIQAEKSFRSAQLSYWTALIDHILGEYQLRMTLGLLMEKPLL
jgi:outer membrane protein